MPVRFVSFVLLLLVSWPTLGQPLEVGGLISYPLHELGPELAVNRGFEAVVGQAPANWSSNGLVSDCSVARTGSCSYRLTNAHQIPYSQSARQPIFVTKGAYRIRGWVKLDGVAATTGNGVRLAFGATAGANSDVGSGTTTIVSGTSGWQLLEKRHIVITRDAEVSLRIEAHGDPDGTAWFDDLELQEELPLPLEAFLLHPSYRGVLFDDEQQTVRIDLALNVELPEQHRVELVVTPENGAPSFSVAFPGSPHLVAEIDGGSLITGQTYRITPRLVRADDGSHVYAHPAYRLSKVAGARRSTMTMSFDQHGRFLVRGRPTFLRGVYDSGLGYNNTEPAWITLLTQNRRLFELPINLYLNYWYGGAPTTALLPLMSVLEDHGALYLQTGNCFGDGYNPNFPIHTDDSYVATLAAHPAMAGYYTADECIAELAQPVFDDYQRLARLDPDSVTFSALNKISQLSYWRDAVDILSPDPYPMYGSEPVEGYPFHLVAQQTRATREAVKHSRPTTTVIQYFKFTSQGRWPTERELRDMTWMAIAEGSNGVFYWSLGANALAYVCSGWCQEKVDIFERLKSVMNELAELDAALVAVDRPELLASNSESTSVRVRVKKAGGQQYLIASNTSPEPLTVRFEWASEITGAEVYGEGRTLAANGRSFTDSFEGYQAHIYLVQGPTIFEDGFESGDLSAWTAVH